MPGEFLGGLPHLEFMPDGRQMRLLRKFGFKDDNGLEWWAPKGCIIDGASIPRALWSVSGPPFVGKYRNSSIIHDHYCKTKTRSFESTHEMFYQSCVVAGLSEFQAGKMFGAIMVGGPRWDKERNPLPFITESDPGEQW